MADCYTTCMKYLALLIAMLWIITMPAMGRCFMPEEDIYVRQQAMINTPVGERIAYWAEQFVGTPYDKDPLGEYVSKNVIIADDRVDCMYLVFRSAELGTTNTPFGAIEAALNFRFIRQGYLNPDGTVQNYGERYQYAEDMTQGGKWGMELTKFFNAPWVAYKGARGLRYVPIIPGKEIPKMVDELNSGDVVYFVKDITRRVVGEVVGHLGIIKREGTKLFLIHASGSKEKGGEVKKVDFGEYVSAMPFVGIMVSRIH